MKVSVQLLNLIEVEVNEYRTNGKFGSMFPQRWLPVAIGILDEGFNEENGTDELNNEDSERKDYGQVPGSSLNICILP
ncbi:MAG: hypothetical protein MZV64_18475 [Ignavibacteriales bacterium]|nr:hypothetical protein [Ignavibacteriales bacterium]